MPQAAIPTLTPALPELFLAGAGMILLMLGVFRRENVFRLISRLAVLTLLLALLFLLNLTRGPVETFDGLFILDGFAVYMKSLILLGAISAVIMSRPYLRLVDQRRFEFPVLIVFATLGMMMMVSANDFLSLYIGLELQSLSLYVLAAFSRDSQRSTEAGLKYFVLGALSSGLLLYGISLIYGFSGSTNFAVLTSLTGDGAPLDIGLLVGLVFVAAGLAFKISAVPFHMWTPDVYEGAPTPVAAFFAAAPKVAAMALVMRVLIGAFSHSVGEWQQIIVFLSITSMLLGAFAALVQTNIKRLMAYSAIGHVGFALMGLAAGTESGVQGVIVYMTIYLTMTVGTFICILNMRTKDGMTESIADLAGLAQTRPALAAAFGIFMFSLAGIPPLAGFFGKVFVFLPAIQEGLIGLALVGALATVVSAVYYIRIFKVMYFDPPSPVLEGAGSRTMAGVMWVAAVFNLLFIALFSPLMSVAEAAARTLFP